MSSYLVLARKWRPAQFADIVGQTHVVRTLMNAIRTGRIHQAYLMTGSRGIGKTSIARIFAKAVRCPDVKTADSPESWLVSCGQCPSCKEIASGNSVDVIEIDGASNNGVDAVREIRENAKYMPATGGKKIYIIDEVHMLTTAAFNALLKTLEEPPAHVIFIFATTEPHKIPATILSRCQRFDLRRVTLAQIQGRLSQVCQAEGIETEAGALALVARAAEGSMRDSLSLLDQVIAYSGQKITTQSARESVGLIEGQTLMQVLRGVLGRKPLDALAAVDQAYQQGHDLKVLTRSLIEFLYGAILAKVGSTGSTGLELSQDEWSELQELTTLRSLEEMELIFQALHQGVEWIARSPQPKIVLDVLLIKCATAEGLAVSEPGASTGGSGGIARPTATAVASGASASTAAPRVVSTSASPQSSSSASPMVKAPAVPVPAAIAPAAPTQNTASAFSAPFPSAAKAPAPSPSPALSASSNISASPVLGSPVAAPSTSPTLAAPTLSAAAPSAGPRSFEGLIQHIRRTRPLLASFLEHAHCDELPDAASPEKATLGLSFAAADNSFRDQLQNRTYSEQLLSLTKEYFGFSVRPRFSVSDLGESPAVRRERERRAREDAAREAARNHPMITEARALFGGELGPIELLDHESGSGGPHATA